MKYLSIFVLSLFVITSLFAQNKTVDKSDLIIGKYWSPKKDGQIEIYKKNNKYFGKIFWSQTPSKDTKNPDANLRNRDLIGSDFLKEFIYEKDDKEWTGGTIYDPNNGKTYKAYMWMEGENLKVKGYIGISLIGRSELFERVK